MLANLIRHFFPSYVSKKELHNLNDNLKNKILLLEKDVSVLNNRVEILNDTNKYLKKVNDSYSRKFFNKNIKKIAVQALVEREMLFYPEKVDKYLKVKLSEGLWEQLYNCIIWQCADDFYSDMVAYRATLEFITYEEDENEEI